MPLSYPEPIDEEGNSWIHAQGGFAGAPFLMRTPNGRVIDISAAPLFLEIASANLRKAFTAHPSDTKGRWIPAITQAEATAIKDAAAYVIWDETGGSRVDLFGAKVRRYQ